MKLAMAQVNPTVGDLQGNLRMVLDIIKKARSRSIDIVALPELVTTGYPPQDLLYDREFVATNKRSLTKIAAVSQGIVAIIGFVDCDASGKLYNAAAIMMGGLVTSIVRKTLLPTYDVFDEDRYFEPGNPDHIRPADIEVSGTRMKIGVQICEDLWDEEYDTKVTDILVQRGAELVVNISASPFHIGKCAERTRLIVEKATKNNIPIFLVNLVGGQDELVFDGQSLAVDGSGRTLAIGKAFVEDLVVTDLDLETGTTKPIRMTERENIQDIHDALVLGVHDYFRKTGFKRAVLGLSGGIDSSVTACIAVDALGASNVIGLSMPSRFSSDHSKTDADLLAANLGIPLLRLPVQGIVDGYHTGLKDTLDQIRAMFAVKPNEEDPVADENIQPRVRGNALMDISNRFKDLRILVLNTGNKTELALGFCTLYGDMSGGVGVLGDVSKLQVYELAHYINRRVGREIVPRSVIDKRPSPELKANQFDPFDFGIVSPLVDEIVQNRRSRSELIEMGFPADVVDDTLNRIRRAEYKRWQAAPCIKITKRAFGIGWKMPIVNKYTG